MSRDKKNPRPNSGAGDNLAEEVLRQGGKGKDEIEKVGAIDRADEIFEKTLDPKFRTAGSPVHRAVWQGKSPLDMFARLPMPQGVTDERAYFAAMASFVEIVRHHRNEGTLFGADNKVTDAVINDLGAAGYWGLLIDPKHGGSGWLLVHFMRLLTQVAAKGDATVAGMNSIDECIGAVDPLEAYGTDDQKARLLPDLASGKKLSAFALTEPGAGSDLTALRTTAVADGDDYVVNGRKLFISNILPGRTIGLVVLIDKKPAVLIVELPETETENFKLDRYGIHAVQHIHNYGIIFENFRVPKKNLLVPPVGDGLTIAYHGLNRGRVALCANAAGVMRLLLKSMLPWAEFRETYGDKIGNRELVQRRVARVAGLIVASDALVEWGASLLDAGYRGELECIVAKIFGSEAQWETAQLALKTHGGRSFLKGHVIGDNLHDYCAPLIYEGEGEMLAMAFFKALVKEHGMKYMAPIAARLAKTGIKKFNPMNPIHLWKLRRELLPYGLWIIGKEIFRGDGQDVSSIHPKLRKHAKFALKRFKKLAREVNYAMMKHQLKLADRQLRMNALSMDIQKTVTILATCQHATGRGDEATIAAADIVCQDLSRQIVGGRETDAYFYACVKLARQVVEGKFHQLDDVDAPTILKPYKK